MFPVQVAGALALQSGHIAEMQTGEGKTLAAVPAVVWFALQGECVHVLTANDYLAKRDAEWMRLIYSWFGLSCGAISQLSTREQRRAAYASHILYATPNEVGFDYLRDGLATDARDLLGQRFGYALIDEADSILLDEARIPLVIAGGTGSEAQFAVQADLLVRHFRPGADFSIGEHSRNIVLTDRGIRRTELAFRCGNLFGEENLPILTAVQDALHAHALLQRGVDDVVKAQAIELVDEFKGRIAVDCRWPAGLQTALEAKEHVAIQSQGRILGSITIQNLTGLYSHRCGMTGTAATQADDFWKMYQLPVTIIPTNRPNIRQDLPDLVFRTAAERDRAVVDEIRRVHETGRPILVGTGSVAHSERIGELLHRAAVPHAVLNAYRDEAEAEIIAQAGRLRAVTISTNMAGRGTDILLAGNPPLDRAEVVALGGLYVIGTTRHEARRIDYQLRGRAGRQGDPGSSRFFLSLEDELMLKYGISENPDLDSVQRTIESQNLQARELLAKYEALPELHRKEVRALRDRILRHDAPDLVPEELLRPLASQVQPPELKTAIRRLLLAVLDDLWADYLANVSELKTGIVWVSWTGKDAFHEFLTALSGIYDDFREQLRSEIEHAFTSATVINGSIAFPETVKLERGATWTYLTTDQPFGSFEERIARGVKKAIRDALKRP